MRTPRTSPRVLDHLALLAGTLFTLLPACGRDMNAPAPAGLDAGKVETDASGSGPDPARGACTAMSSKYPPGRQTGQLVVGGSTRTFVLQVPNAAAPGAPMPLVILLHGGLGTGAQMETSSVMSPIADREGFVVVYPDGLNRSWNAGRCCGPPADQNFDDVGFIAGLIDHLESELCIDPRRIYAGGMSNGAMMSHRLGCELSERLAAIAPVSGTNMTDTCKPIRPVAIMHIHGTDDKHVPWEGGLGCGIAGVPYLSVPESIAGWGGRNGCTTASPELVVEQGDGRCELQGHCTAGAEVVLCTIAGGGHSWPGGAAKEAELPACRQVGEGDQSRTFIASEQIWAFFKAHALPEKSR